ncbi:5'-deoxynucleotidase [Photobacterium kishitanii]|uniref:5'-deoxynucleotidase n=1 Tax=Photobacterium kishitanii TaxID=318456 RepID=A0A2T3KLW3_9GAMM|nr:5'-deoxynucleotidase [Photobacterium kishitanii]PSV00666.1 5'-deoxynucleotidase [Photobacterium kishitanii]
MNNQFSKYKPNSLVAWMLRLKYMIRWPLMRSSIKESVAEHTVEVAVIAHHLAVIAKVKFGKDTDPQMAATYSLYHEASEAGGTSDIPTPVKYSSPVLTEAFKALEHEVETGMVDSYSDNEIKEYMSKFIVQRSIPAKYKTLVKAADIIARYIKSMQEVNNKNREFTKAAERAGKDIEHYSKELPEVAYFIEHFLDPCEKTLDDLIM